MLSQLWGITGDMKSDSLEQRYKIQMKWNPKWIRWHRHQSASVIIGNEYKRYGIIQSCFRIWWQCESRDWVDKVLPPWCNQSLEPILLMIFHHNQNRSQFHHALFQILTKWSLEYLVHGMTVIPSWLVKTSCKLMVNNQNTAIHIFHLIWIMMGISLGRYASVSYWWHNTD